MIDIIFHDKTGVTPYNPGQTGGFENAAGSGEIHYYRLFDGVGIMLLRLEMETYTEIRTQIGMIEINFCINGRFETSFSMRDSVLLKPGPCRAAAKRRRQGRDVCRAIARPHALGTCVGRGQGRRDVGHRARR